jgi:hypothetical protein
MSAGIQVNAPEDVPESHPPLKNKNDAAAAASRSRSAPQRRNHPLKKFLEHDGQILRYTSLPTAHSKYSRSISTLPTIMYRKKNLHKIAATFLKFIFSFGGI